MADSSLVAGDAAPGAAAGERRWDVALSFAGNQRPYVEQVAAALKARDVRPVRPAWRPPRPGSRRTPCSTWPPAAPFAAIRALRANGPNRARMPDR